MTGALVSFGAALGEIINLFRITRSRVAGRKFAMAHTEVRALKLTDASTALGLCAVARLALGLSSHRPVAGGGLGAVAILGVVAAVGAVYVPDGTAKVAGLIGLGAVLIGVGVPDVQGVTVALLVLIVGFLIACGFLRRRFT